MSLIINLSISPSAHANPSTHQGVNVAGKSSCVILKTKPLCCVFLPTSEEFLKNRAHSLSTAGSPVNGKQNRPLLDFLIPFFRMCPVFFTGDQCTANIK